VRTIRFPAMVGDRALASSKIALDVNENSKRMGCRTKHRELIAWDGKIIANS